MFDRNNIDSTIVESNYLAVINMMYPFVKRLNCTESVINPPRSDGGMFLCYSNVSMYQATDIEDSCLIHWDRHDLAVTNAWTNNVWLWTPEEDEGDYDVRQGIKEDVLQYLTTYCVNWTAGSQLMCREGGPWLHDAQSSV